MTNPSQETINELVDLYNQNQVDILIRKIEDLVHKFPFSHSIWNLSGVANLKINQYYKAELSFKKALDFSQNNIGILNNLSISLRNQYKYSEAIEGFKKSLTIDNNQFKTYFFLGDTLNKVGEKKEAISSLEQATIMNPNFLEACDTLASIYKDQCLFEKAIVYYQKVVSLKPNSAEPYYNLANTLVETNQNTKAILNYKKAIKINPKLSRPYLNLGNTFIKEKKYNMAFKYLKLAIKIKPDYFEAYHSIGHILENQKKYQTALINYKKAISLNSKFVSSYNNIANIYIQLGQLKFAIMYYKYALSLDKNCSDAFINLLSIEVQSSGNLIDNSSIENSEISKEIIQNPKYNILKAIINYIYGDTHKSNKYLGFYKKNLNSVESKKSNLKDLKFCYGYFSFLDKVIKRPLIVQKTNNKIFHFGESHCLSFANNIINYDNKKYRIIPQLTIGGKAFHFAEENNNIFKAITKFNLLKLPKQSNVFISFGEIDCRHDEGFIKASSKKNIPIHLLIKETINNYVIWFKKISFERKYKLFFLNIPAPVYNDKLNEVENKKVSEVVAEFNKELNKTLTYYSIALIDVYRFTKNKKNFSNKKFHCDQRHLDNRILKIIESQLSN